MNEEKELRGIIERLDRSKKPFYSRKWFPSISWFLLVVTILFFNWLLEKDVNAFLILSMSIFIGGVLGMVELFRYSHNSWSIIAPHINRESIEIRLKELNA